MKDDDPNNLSDANVLGEEDFKIFWPGEGMRALTYFINKEPGLLPEVQIIKSNGKEIAVEKFLDEIKKFKIKKI
jgi:hypothetical protein